MRGNNGPCLHALEQEAIEIGLFATSMEAAHCNTSLMFDKIFHLLPPTLIRPRQTRIITAARNA